ncbi:DNA-3-methyladenine glycosylase [Balneicella halophila]|uniref:Putative 3-methyladenine DNA glycosylase n=1 Tax=Balneicella halophila TaxID=1537566 RepID=A0A7L4URD8_BALHA|nr:DNA-3-methyladenine glycosylase [Balneicella halophila]PVX51797.1 DNA-3-methyladenine glycosylase [Balneicella halophila]
MSQNVVPHSYFLKENVVALAKELLGKRVVTVIDGERVSGIINETEAYAGVIDKASHAYGNRRTKRTEIMYKQGGHIYVYLCYGIHSLLNIVTNRRDIPHAILIRSIVPDFGLNTMCDRRGILNLKNIANGPGKVAQALGILPQHTGLLLGEKKEHEIIWIEEGISVDDKLIEATPRIGIDYAEEDKHRPWRFVIPASEIHKKIEAHEN